MAEYDNNSYQPDEGVEIPVEFGDEETVTEEPADVSGTEDEAAQEPDTQEEPAQAEASETEPEGAECPGEAGESADTDECTDTDECADTIETEEPADTEETGECADAQEADDSASEGEPAAESGEKAGKTGWFGRKKNKEKEKFEQQIAELTDLLRRNRAEFDNFRKRTEKEKTNMYKIGARDIVEKILPVVDSFERGLSQAQEGDPFAEGMQLIYKQLMTALEELGVKPIEAVGQPFDPDFHNAVMHVDDEEQGENTIVEVFQEGFTVNDRVIRFAMVKVAN